MENIILKNLGKHRILMLVCAILLYFIYPSEETQAAVREWKEGKYLFWFYPFAAYLVFVWVALSDLLANLWRFVEFLVKKETLWHYAPIAADLIVVILLWLCYTHNINPPPPEPEEEEALLRLLIQTFRC